MIDRLVQGTDEPLSSLRGASVDVDLSRLRLAGRALLLVLTAAAGVIGVVSLVAAVHKNERIDAFHDHGVPVSATITHCDTQYGGTGTTPAGFTCSASYTLRGSLHRAPLQGVDRSYDVGALVAAVALPNDAAMLETAATEASARATWTEFILPAALLTVFAAFASMVLVRWRARRRRSAPV